MLLITSVVLSYWHYNVIPDIMTETWFKRLSQMCQRLVFTEPWSS